MSQHSRWLMMVTLAFVTTLAAAQGKASWDSLMAQGLADRQQGRIDLSIEQLQRAHKIAGDDPQRMLSASELGASLLQARKLDQAELLLGEAYALATDAQRARLNLDLGNLAMLRRDPAGARAHYLEARQGAGETATAVRADLNLTRLAPRDDRLTQLSALYAQMDADPQTRQDAGLYLHLGQQALDLGDPARALAGRSLERAGSLASQQPGSRLQLESLDALAQLYERQGRTADALRLTRQALAYLRADTGAMATDLAIALEWKLGRLQQALGHDQAALAAFERAVNHVERMRPDIPIDYDDGQSSFRATFEPIYMGLVDKLLTTSGTLPDSARELMLRRARDTLELLKQTEMQDYLGDRCAVDTVKGGSATVILPGTAVVYPVLFPDRLELLLETGATLTRYTTPVASEQVQEAAAALARELRRSDGHYLAPAQKLYDWVLRPLDGFLAAHAIDTVVIIPDATLRVVPLGALHDGSRYAIEKYAIATVTGLSMTNTSPAPRTPMAALVAGASSFGGVVDKYGSTRLADLLGTEPDPPKALVLASSRMLRSPRAGTTRSATDPARTRAERLDSMRDALALPGVTREIEALARILPGTRLLDAGFTVEAFRLAAQSAPFRIVHVASHGVFGGTPESSYIMAYDDLLTLDGLQTLLKGEQFRKHPIELLSLSACETAAGNDRAPLGISGAAMKARAKSVLGTLWPVDDEAAVQVMEQFYTGLTQHGLSKAQALRQSQRQLMGNPQLSHPFFWAPFALIGNWL